MNDLNILFKNNIIQTEFIFVCFIFHIGTNVMSENAIIDLPTGVVTFYMDVNEPRTPGKTTV